VPIGQPSGAAAVRIAASIITVDATPTQPIATPVRLGT